MDNVLQMIVKATIQQAQPTSKTSLGPTILPLDTHQAEAQAKRTQTGTNIICMQGMTNILQESAAWSFAGCKGRLKNA